MRFCFSVYDMNGDGFIGRWDQDSMNMAVSVPESSLQRGDGDPAEGEFDYCSERQLH